MFEVLGPQVAIIDDKREEIISIETILNKQNIGNRFFQVDYIEPDYPPEPLNTIELVFLDLFYNPNYGADFEPYICSEWINRIIPPGKRYILVIWSKDAHRTAELLSIMEELKITLPFFVETKEKKNYQTGENEYDIQKLLDELKLTVETKEEIQNENISGKIIALDEDSVLINCLIYKEPATFEVRRFDLQPFKNYINLEIGKFISIKITTKAGSRTFEFYQDNSDQSELFAMADEFEDIGDIDFLDDK